MSVQWKPVSNTPVESPTAMWLMQDGSVLVSFIRSKQLKALYPDKKGSYANGSWVSVGEFLLEKLYFASAVLSDGRLIACGGEYTGPSNDLTETNFCEIYDPVAGVSSALTPPPGWAKIGDSPSAVLSDGSFLLGNVQDMVQHVARLNPATLTWTIGGGDMQQEQGYVLLQTGDVLTVNVMAPGSKRYHPPTGNFVADAPLPVMLGANNEIGPGITLMDGRVIWFGATGHTCVYTPGGAGVNGSWDQGPDLPLLNGEQLAANDSPAILEPNGRVFLLASTHPLSGNITPQVAFLEYDPVLNSFTSIPAVTTAPIGGYTFEYNMLLLPNGHGLVCVAQADGPGWYELTFESGYFAAWAPTITSFPVTCNPGDTVSLDGTQLCGLSECAQFGDDNQQAEHYPMVRFVNMTTNDVTYARAHDVSTRSIAQGEPGTVLVDIPAMLPQGKYCVEVVAMGIPSACVQTECSVLRIHSAVGAIAALLFGGIARDGGGFIVIHGVRIPVDPGPLERVFPDLSTSLQDTLLGESIARLAGFLNTAAAGNAIRAIVSNLDAVQQWQQPTAPQPALPQSTMQEPVSQPRGSIWAGLAFAVLGFAVGVGVALVMSKVF